jgi:transcriptional regulator with XRE-family HTH domain
MTFAEVLKTKREAAGLTKFELARRAKVMPSTITCYEQGKNSPRWAILQRLADVLGISTDDLRDRPVASAKPTAEVE